MLQLESFGREGVPMRLKTVEDRHFVCNHEHPFRLRSLKHMFKKIIGNSLAAILLLVPAITGSCQSVPSAEADAPTLTVGAGVSNFYLDFCCGRRMNGIDVWVQWRPNLGSQLLNRLSFQLEGRDINYGRPSSLSKMRQDTGLVGINGRIYRHHRFLIYGKAMGGMGSIDFPPFTTDLYYTHDTRNIWAAGAGVDYRISSHLTVRGDYEYQWWPNLFGRQHALTPNGVTIGAGWNFGRARR